jgi:hypothetical protein
LSYCDSGMPSCQYSLYLTVAQVQLSYCDSGMPLCQCGRSRFGGGRQLAVASHCANIDGCI